MFSLTAALMLMAAGCGQSGTSTTQSNESHNTEDTEDAGAAAVYMTENIDPEGLMRDVYKRQAVRHKICRHCIFFQHRDPSFQ